MMLASATMTAVLEALCFRVSVRLPVCLSVRACVHPESLLARHYIDRLGEFD